MITRKKTVNIYKLVKKIQNQFKKITKKKYLPYFIILLFSMLIMLPTLLGKFYVGDDTLFHLYNISTYSKHLPSSIFAKILPEFENNLGYGLTMFYPPLPHIVGSIVLKTISIISFGKFGIVAMESILHFMICLFSGITMYWLGGKVFNGNKKKALIASLFYITYNYFFVNIIIRDALNESFTFIFIPLVFLGLWHLLINKNYKMFYIWFILGYVGLMYSHLVMSVYFTLFLILFLLLFVKEIFNKKAFFSLLFASILILIFTSTFTVPMIEHKLFGDYLIFAEHRWEIKDVWAMPFQGYFINYNFRSNDHGGLIYSNLNFIVIIFYTLALFRIFTKKTNVESRKFLLGIAIFGWGGILGNAFVSIWTHIPSIFLSIQFVWRLSLFVGFGFALVAAEGLESYLNIFKQKYIYIALTIIIIFLGVFVLENNSKIRFESLSSLRNNERYTILNDYYFPAKIFKNEGHDYYLKRNSNKIIVMNGKANVKILKNNVPNMTFKVTNLQNKATLELPRIYYLGYTIMDKDKNNLQYKEDKHGFVSLQIDKSGIYEVKYTGTLAYKVATAIKYITIIILLGYFGYKYRKKIKF